MVRSALIRFVLFIAFGLGIALAGSAAAQSQPAKTARVGWIGWVDKSRPTSMSIPHDGLRAGLRERGWIEGRNLVLVARWGDRDQAKEIAADMVRSGVDVIVAQGPMVINARSAAGNTPMVFALNGDPVEAKLVASLSRPGGMSTGIFALALELGGKRLDLLKQAVPSVTRVAALANARHPGVNRELREAQESARRLGISLQFVPVQNAGDFPAAFEAIAREGAEAILAFPDTLIDSQAAGIAEFAARRRIPSISGWADFAEAGNLMSYGPNASEFYRQLGDYVDRILRGGNPADIPVQHPARFDLVVNRKTAQALGIVLPPILMARTDRIID